MIELYDTTLRDGTQGEGICLTLQDKLRITSILDGFGIGLIEGGWPGSNPKDMAYFEHVQDIPLEHATVAAFGSTCRPALVPDQDANLRALIESKAAVLTIFGKTWLRHVKRVLRTDANNNLRLIRDSVRYLSEQNRRVIYDAEHFFDGYQDDADYALATLHAAVEGGAKTVVLCDTNGGMMPWQVEAIVRRVSQSLDACVGIHAHNDGGCAVANSVTALRAGARHVQGTMNGIGERCGNADLCAVIANIELKLGEQSLPKGRLDRLTEVARTVAEICNSAPATGAPYVGRSAFAHKGGVHVAAIQRDEGCYEHCDPHTVGNNTRVLVSELSGRGNIRSKAKEFGINLDDATTGAGLLTRIKHLENEGYAFEAADASVELMMRRERGDHEPFFELIDFMVVVEHRDKRGHLAEANVKIRVGDQVIHTVAEGAGPVRAMDLALRKALHDTYPTIGRFHLVDYKVRILDGIHGTRARTRVLIDTGDGKNTWSTVGASRNIIEASWQALHDSFEYGLLKHHRTARTATAVLAAEPA